MRFSENLHVSSVWWGVTEGRQPDVALNHHNIALYRCLLLQCQNSADKVNGWLGCLYKDFLQHFAQPPLLNRSGQMMVETDQKIMFDWLIIPGNYAN